MAVCKLPSVSVPVNVVHSLQRICITMNLNSHVWHCVLTLIYSLYKWVNKFVGKKGELENAHHRPTREETEGGAGSSGGERGS